VPSEVCSEKLAWQRNTGCWQRQNVFIVGFRCTQDTDDSRVQKITLNWELDIYRAAGKIYLGRMFFLSFGSDEHMPQLRSIPDKGLVIR
jgi:hypothetical protein